MKIIDNFLEESEFKRIKDYVIYDGSLPWHLQVGVSEIGNRREGILFTHMFYWHHQVRSHNFEILEPLLKIINPHAVVRIKANFYPTTSEIIHHDFHVDFLDTDDVPVPCKACLFYLNTNNGKTIFKNGDEIDSVENRAVFFDASIPHKSTTCTDDSIGRFNINFNYF